MIWDHRGHPNVLRVGFAEWDDKFQTEGPILKKGAEPFKFSGEEDAASILQPRHWQKFDSIRIPIHGYIYSIKRLGIITEKVGLDLGCGTGWLSVILAKRGARVEAVDISTEAIMIAENTARINHVEDRVNTKVGSAYQLEYPANYFDFIIGQAILHHLADKSEVASLLHQILKPGGKAVFFEPFGESMLLEKFRLLIPVQMDEENRSHWKEKIKYEDIDAFEKFFAVTYKEFHLLSRLDRVISNRIFINCLGLFDLLILKFIPFLRRYARTIVIELSKPDGHGGN